MGIPRAFGGSAGRETSPARRSGRKARGAAAAAGSAFFPTPGQRSAGSQGRRAMERHGSRPNALDRLRGKGSPVIFERGINLFNDLPRHLRAGPDHRERSGREDDRRWPPPDRRSSRAPGQRGPGSPGRRARRDGELGFRRGLSQSMPRSRSSGSPAMVGRGINVSKAGWFGSVAETWTSPQLLRVLPASNTAIRSEAPTTIEPKLSVRSESLSCRGGHTTTGLPPG